MSRMHGRTPRITARDVAELVGVSPATVSLVVNGKSEGRVAPAQRDRVLEAVRELGYRVHSAASNLARGRPGTVAFVSPNPTNPFFSELLDGLLDELAPELSLSLTVPSRGDDYDIKTVERAIAGDLAALVLAGPGRDLLGVSAPCPLVLIDAGSEREDAGVINLDLVGAGRLLADHLVDLGHRRIGYVGLERDKLTFLRRREALSDRLRERGAAIAADSVVHHPSIEEGRLVGQRVLTEWVRAGVTAIVAADDLLAFGILLASADLGVEIPRQLSLAGFNDVPYASMTRPTLTSVDLRARELGICAAQSLQQLLGGTVPAPVLLDTELRVRESTARARD